MSREADLKADSLAVGDAWVERVQLDLRRDHRHAAGGWPGTLREARACTYAHFTNETSTSRYGALTRDELEVAVRDVYNRARVRGLACARTDDEENA